MTVTVAVVSYNTHELLLRCLRSLARDADAQRCEVWVLDNCSSDGSAAGARAQAPWAHVIEASSNLGFGVAVNTVVARTQSEWILAMNADIALEPGALESMLAAAGDQRVGVVAPRLLLADGSTQHSVHPFPTVPLTLAFNLGLPRLLPALADRLCLEGFWNSERARDVPWAIGACLLVRRTAFDAAGGFDNRQWMYAEDLDLCWRLHEHGWRIRYEPAARARHESEAATAVAFGGRQSERFMAATYAMLLRRRGRTRTALTEAINIVGAAARVAWMTPLALAHARWRGPARDSRRWLGAHVRGALGCSRLARRR